MEHYFVNIELASNDHIVHKEGCMYIPNITKRYYLGFYLTAEEALSDACRIYQDAKVCKHCIQEVYAEICIGIE